VPGEGLATGQVDPKLIEQALDMEQGLAQMGTSLMTRADGGDH